MLPSSAPVQPSTSTEILVTKAEPTDTKTLASMVAQGITIPMPPPPYTGMPSVIPLTDTTFDAYSEYSDSDCEDDDNMVEAAQLAPVNIIVDASIKIDGQSNRLILPSLNDPKPSYSPTTLAATIRAIQQAKTERITAIVLAALRRAGSFDAGKEGRPVNVKINAGLAIKGRGNVVAIGGMRLAEKQQGATDMLQRKRRAASVSATCDASHSVLD